MTDPSRYGPWVVEREMGEGAFARVMLAHDPEVPQRRAAVKVLREEWRGRKMFRERFAEEASTLELLGSGAVRIPSLAAYFGADTQGDIPWIAIEYIDGRPLDDVIRDGQLPDGRLAPRAPQARAQFGAEIIKQVSEALAFAHRRGIVHRDIKPENVLIGKDGRVVIIDFGIARDARAKRHTGEHLPSPMTPDYAAPELLKSEVSEHLEPALDVYALGCTLYQTLTGDLPAITHSGQGRSVQYVPRGAPLDLPEGWPHHLRTLVRAMTLPDPMSRPSLPQIIATIETGRVPISMASTQPPSRHSDPQPGVAFPTAPGVSSAHSFPPSHGTGPYNTGGPSIGSGAITQGGAAVSSSQVTPPALRSYGQPAAMPSGAYPVAGGPPHTSARNPGYYPSAHAGGRDDDAKPLPQTRSRPAAKVSRPKPRASASFDTAPRASSTPLLRVLLVALLFLGGATAAALVLQEDGPLLADLQALWPAPSPTDGQIPGLDTDGSSEADDDRALHTLQIETIPSGAQVSVNGYPIGTTPTQARLEPGLFLVEFTHPRFRKISEVVSATEGRVKVDLASRHKRSQIILTTERYEGAEIRVDGKPAGRVPAVIDLAPGKHVVQLMVSGVPLREEVEVKPQTTTKVSFK